MPTVYSCYPAEPSGSAFQRVRDQGPVVSVAIRFTCLGPRHRTRRRLPFGPSLRLALPSSACNVAVCNGWYPELRDALVAAIPRARRISDCAAQLRFSVFAAELEVGPSGVTVVAGAGCWKVSAMA
jgi:hypothetical protein